MSNIEENDELDIELSIDFNLNFMIQKYEFHLGTKGWSESFFRPVPEDDRMLYVSQKDDDQNTYYVGLPDTLTSDLQDYDLASVYDFIQQYKLPSNMPIYNDLLIGPLNKSEVNALFKVFIATHTGYDDDDIQEFRDTLLILRGGWPDEEHKGKVVPFLAPVA